MVSLIVEYIGWLVVVPSTIVGVCTVLSQLWEWMPRRWVWIGTGRLKEMVKVSDAGGWDCYWLGLCIGQMGIGILGRKKNPAHKEIYPNTAKRPGPELKRDDELVIPPPQA